MDFIIEFFLEVVLEGIIEIAFHEKVSKWIRYPMILITVLLFLSVIGLFFFLGILCIKKNIWISLFLFFMGSFFFLSAIKKIKTYQKKKKSI